MNISEFAQENSNTRALAWNKLVSSIRSRRSPGARFFKPVCVIAAIDLTDEGLLDPSEMDAEEIIFRFRRYVGVIHPERAELGWRPLWHVSNDGLWTFYKEGEPLHPDDFGRHRRPDMKAELFDRFDLMTIAHRYMEDWREPSARKSLRNAMLDMLSSDDDTCRPFARQLADPALALTPDAWPADTGTGREQLDLFGKPTGIELVDETEGLIKEPFDPESIDVVTRHITVSLLLSRAGSERLDLQPDFQRRWGLWDASRQSRLIESLLLRIPLPVLYMAEDKDERWEVVDGIQRLSTIARFVDPQIVVSAPLVLTGLEYLRDYEGKTFHDLADRLKVRLLETELQVHLIRAGTPPDVKFNVFKRINTGGVQLSAQEIRHAITPGIARGLLEDWAEEPAFLRATDYGVKSSRMEDRELVLRFLAFHLRGPDSYRLADMDKFLIEAMGGINELNDGTLLDAHHNFVRAMSAAHTIFGNDAFRKRLRDREKRKPINKALFEAVSVNLAALDDRQLRRLVSRKLDVRAALIALMHDREFEASISQGTADVGKVRRRFRAVEQVFVEIAR